MADARLTADTAIDKPPRRRRWIPLSLKIFLAMVVLAGSAGLLMDGAPIYRLYRQQMAIRTIDRLGGRVGSRPGGARRLRSVLGDGLMTVFDDVTSVNLSNTQATDRDLVNFGALQKLEDLDLSQTQITDKGLQQVVELRKLTSLRLESTQVTDKGLQDVIKLPNLWRLSLEGTHVTDNGIEQLAALKRLSLLIAYGTGVTAGGVEHLEEDLPYIEIQWKTPVGTDFYFIDPGSGSCWGQRQQEREARVARRLARPLK